ncbi:MAG: DNA cytosine methyltransferase [Eubacterium sp.]|nr:DNA cytosine methyltransferase [Eubacterium sp.]
MGFLFDLPQPELTKKIRLITLFSGVGSQEMAMRDIGVDFEIYKAVEFDKYAIASYNAIHNTTFPTIDIRDVHGKDLEITDKDKYNYLMFYSFPCFTADTLILTDKGLKRIVDVKADDKVLTHANRYQKVLASKKTGEKEIYKIKGMGIDEIECTANHRFYTRKLTRYFPTYADGRRGNCRRFEAPEWVECKDLTKKHYLGVAINQNEIIPEWNGITFDWSDGRKSRQKNELSELMNNESFWWIVGRYLGDGWFRTQGGIIICCAKDEMGEIISHLEDCNFNYSISEERTVNKIHIPLKELSKFLEPFGKGAENKTLPGFVFDMPCNLLESLLEGYFSADGYVKNGLYKSSSVSKKLTYGFAQIVAKVYKTPYRIYRCKRNPKVVIEGRLCNQKDGYELVFKKEKKKQDKAFYEDGFIWFPIQSIENTKQIKPVYDLETEIDHSFTANGVIAHNCTDLSVAGKMGGMSKDDWESGESTRSGLLWEVERILKELPDDQLPDVLVMENVPQVHSEQNMPDFNKWLEYLKSRGYFNYWEDLNAKDFGIPQNRDRCFCISLLSKDFIEFEFPKKIPLQYVMKDFLEEKVADKYYIRSEKADKLIKELIEDGKLD